MSEFQQYAHLEDLDSESKYLVHKAKEATQHAYAPYSKLLVGSALILEDGTLVTGSNQENASFPLCICAERIALYNAATCHFEKKIKKLAVVAHKKSHKDLIPATPCGACRQVLFEFEERQQQPIQLIMYGPGKEWTLSPSAHALLPLGFNKESLFL